MTRAAAIASWILGIGFGIPALYGARHLATRGEIWILLGFPTYGEGPFESIGIPTTPALMLTFAAVCAIEIALGVLLWRRRRAGIILSIALLPLELVFWIGFALPVGPLLGLVRTGLAVAGHLTERPLGHSKQRHSDRRQCRRGNEHSAKRRS